MSHPEENQFTTYKVGLNHVGAYQASGVPYATGSLSLSTTAHQVQFPHVSQEFTVYNQGPNALRVGYTQNGTNGTSAPNAENNYFLVASGSNSGRVRVKVTEVWMRADSGTAVASVSAALTRIQVQAINNNWSGSSGVG